jgi:hypothetical protein
VQAEAVDALDGVGIAGQLDIATGMDGGAIGAAMDAGGDQRAKFALGPITSALSIHDVVEEGGPRHVRIGVMRQRADIVSSPA